MNRTRRLLKYIKEYRWSNIFAMIRNSKADPLICRRDCAGRLVVITGATSGIGYWTARKYAACGADLLCINRNGEKSQALCRELKAGFGAHCEYLLADLSRLEDVNRAARELAALSRPIEVLIHNAGIYSTTREETADGLEKVFAVNHLAPFLITYRLMDKLKSQDSARILLVSSEGHRFAAWGVRPDDLNWQRRRYSGLRGYGSAKTAQLLTMLIFADRFAGSGVSINAMHPGAVKTQAGRDNGPLYRWFKQNILEKNFPSPEISAEALYYLGMAEELEGISGRFFNLTTEEEPAPPALDRETAAQVWKESLELGGIDDDKEL